MNFRKVQPTDFLETVDIYVFCCVDYKYHSRNWRKFDFHGKNHKSPIKHIFSHVYLSKYCEFWNMFWTNVIDFIKIHILNWINFHADDIFREKRGWSWKVVTRCLKKRPLQNSVSFHQLCYRFPGKLLWISEKCIEHKICIFT